MSTAMADDGAVLARPRTPLETKQQEDQTEHLGSLSPPRIIRTYHLKHHSSPGEELNQVMLEEASSSNESRHEEVSNSGSSSPFLTV
ncbi:hypothetical protein JCM5350_004104 [Sporobolomyces pararoseus]